MNLDDQYRTTQLKKEIIDAIVDIHIETSAVLIWQNQKETRVITKVKIENIDFINNSITLSPFSNKDVENFKRLKLNSTIYLKGKTKSIIFKNTAVAKKNKFGNIDLQIPETVKMFENRSVPRMIFSLYTPKKAAGIFPGGNSDISVKPIAVVLNDVSNTGMGFLLEKKHLRFFIEKDQIKIDKIAHYQFPKPISGKIIFTSNTPDLFGQFRVGVLFNEKISNDILNLLNLAE
jgi:hypothetical protein